MIDIQKIIIFADITPQYLTVASFGEKHRFFQPDAVLYDDWFPIENDWGFVIPYYNVSYVQAIYFDAVIFYFVIDIEKLSNVTSKLTCVLSKFFAVGAFLNLT